MSAAYVARVLALSTLLVSCGGTVVFEDEGGSAEGGASATSQASGTTRPTSTSTSSGTGASGSASGSGSSSTGASSTGAGGDGTDGSCIAPDYCSCIAMPTCKVVAEDCFCSCDEPCSEPCDCDCAGGAFLMCAPGSIEDRGALDVGVWLVGWSGDVNHFSWLRFEPDGRLLVLDGATLVGNSPYFPCSGTGTWSFTEDWETVQLDLPAACPATSLTFGEWRPLWPSPPNAVQEVFLFDVGEGVSIGAWRFTDDTCSPDFTSCADPLAP